jgi:hypothetical protein
VHQGGDVIFIFDSKTSPDADTWYDITSETAQDISVQEDQTGKDFIQDTEPDNDLNDADVTPKILVFRNGEFSCSVSNYKFYQYSIESSVCPAFFEGESKDDKYILRPW